MKVLQVITSLGTGGAEKLIIDSVPLYQNKGIGSDVLCLNNNVTPFWKHLIKKSNTNIFGLTSGSVYNPFLVFKIIPYLKKYDVIHAHLFPVLYWVVFAKWISFSNVPIVYTEHSTNNKRRHHFLLKKIDKWVYSKLQRIITIADEVDSNLKQHLNNKVDQKIHLINNGVDIKLYSKAVSLPKTEFYDENSFLLIQVSSFREPKDQPTLIKSLTSLPANIKLLLVGKGPLQNKNEVLVNQLGLKDRVKFLGVRTDIPNLLKTVDIVILSSKYEGLSLSSIEGMAAKPFIASDVPGLREIVQNYGLLFKQGDSDELANLILKLFNDKALYSKVAERCYQRAVEFDINKMVDEYIEIFNSIVK